MNQIEQNEPSSGERSSRQSRGGRSGRSRRGGQRRTRDSREPRENRLEETEEQVDTTELTAEKPADSRPRSNRSNRSRHDTRQAGGQRQGESFRRSRGRALRPDGESALEETASAAEGVQMAAEEIPAEPLEPSCASVEPAPPETPVEVVGVRFKPAGKVYYFAPGELKVAKHSFVIVETARGIEFGEVAMANKIVDAAQIVPPLRPVLRAANDEDVARNAENKQREKDAFKICQEKIAEYGLDMKLVDVEYTFDRNKLLFYFTSDGRVDFRDLVKNLASIFRTRIELRQIGIRDEAKLMGGLGICGRPLCCASFLSDFVQVSIRMAKEQNLSLNSTKISGVCGRLMCCLRYENETYEEELRRSPAVDAVVRTPDGTGVVSEVNPLAGTVRVRFPENTPPPKLYPRDEVKVIGRAAKGGRPEEIFEDA